MAGPARTGPSAGRALPPLDDHDELVRLLARLMEDASDLLAVERGPSPGRSGSSARCWRAGKCTGESHDGPFSGREITADMACLAAASGGHWLAWTGGLLLRRPEYRSPQ